MEAGFDGGGRPPVSRIVFLVEEKSMKEVLHRVLREVLEKNTNYLVITHEGKSDLDRSIVRKLKAFPRDDNFVILRDQDSSDCKILKSRIRELCIEAGRPDALVRIVCHELESWFLGDLVAVEKAFSTSGIARRQDQRSFRTPDQVPNASQVLRRMIPDYQKISGSRSIAGHMNLNNNRSHSFKVFLDGLKRLTCKI